MKIKQKLTTLVLGAFMLVLAFVVMTPSVFASTTCGGVETSVISCKSPCADKGPVGSDGKCSDGSAPSKKTEDTGVWSILLMAINILSAGVGIAAIGGVVYGAILYTSAGGSQEQVKKAMGVITNVVIGVIAYALMFSLLNFLIPGGLFH